VALERDQRAETIATTGDWNSVPACLDEAVPPSKELFGGPEWVARE
jgi:hypothetical protein